MQDLSIVLRHFFDWRFCLILTVLISVGLVVPVRYLQPARSVRFNVWLFVVIALASALGTFIPQNKPAADSLAKFGPFWTNAFDKMGFFNIYHTWWFSALLAIMAFDVVVCKLRKLPMLVHGPVKKSKLPPEEELFKRARLHATLSSEAAPDTVARGIRKWMKSRNLKFQEQPIEVKKGAGRVFFAGRQRVQRWGDFILHVSIVMILAGGLMGAMFGFEEVLPVVEGETVKMTNRPLEVTLRDFEIQYYAETGAPSLYASDLVVAENGQVVGEKRVVVNEPLDIKRVRFYQASWGMTPDFRSAVVHLAGKPVELKPKEIHEIPGTKIHGNSKPLSVRLNRFLPSFTVDEHGHAETSDYEGRNPAVQIDFLRGENVEASLWLLKNNPELAFKVTGDIVEPTHTPPFFLIDVDPVLFSGIQVGYDPGAPIFWAGAIFLLIGLSLHFYLHQRRLRILLVESGKGTEIRLGGWNSRTPEEFRPEFERWTDELRRAAT